MLLFLFEKYVLMRGPSAREWDTYPAVPTNGMPVSEGQGHFQGQGHSQGQSQNHAQNDVFWENKG